SLAPLRSLAPFALGAALAVAVLVPLATWRGGAGAWSGFAANSRKLLATPLFNHVGALPLAAFEPARSARRLEQPAAAEPNAVWKQAQRARRAERAWLVVAVAALWALLYARALPRLGDWSAAALATATVPLATALTGYYHAVLVALALLVALHPGAGIAMALLAAVTQVIAFGLPYADVPFVAMSAAELVAIFGVTGLLARRAAQPAPAAFGATAAGR
ncbi:MAG: hypothetical protein DCC71_16350, partial [Proteobacteria bacterium]